MGGPVTIKYNKRQLKNQEKQKKTPKMVAVFWDLLDPYRAPMYHKTTSKIQDKMPKHLQKVLLSITKSHSKSIAEDKTKILS